MVKKCGLLKIVHDKNKSKTESPVLIEPYLNALDHNKEIEALIPKNLVSLYNEHCDYFSIYLSPTMSCCIYVSSVC